MGFFMRCNHVYPNGKRCAAETPFNRSALQGNDWFIEPLIGGTRTICPKHKAPHVAKRLKEIARQHRIKLAVDRFRMKLEQQPDTADDAFASAASALAEAFRKSGTGRKIVEELDRLGAPALPAKEKGGVPEQSKRKGRR